MRKVRVIFLIILTGSLLIWENRLFSQSYPFREYTVGDGLPQSQSTGIYQDSRGYLWILTKNGLSLFDGVEFVNFFKKDGLDLNTINDVFEDSDGNIYAISQNGLSKFNGRKFTYYPPPAGQKKIDYAGGYNPGIEGDILLLGLPADSKKGRLISFENGKYTDYSAKFINLDTTDIKSCEYDYTSNEFFILDKFGYAYTWKNDILKRISDLNFTNIVYENGKIGLLAQGIRFHYSKNRLVRIPEKSSSEWPWDLENSKFEPADFFSILTRKSDVLKNTPYDMITSYIVDNESNVWIGTEQNFFRLISTAFSSFSSSNGLIKNIWSLSQDKKGHIWFGSLYGDLQEYDGKQFHLRNDYKPLFKSGVGFFKGSRMMSDGDVYFSTNQGVLIWDGKSFSRLKGIPEDSQVCCIYEDPVNKCVLVSTHVGLFKFDDEVVTEYKEFNDESLGVIEGIVSCGNGKYWLSGHKGLMLFDEKQTIHVTDSVLPQSLTYTLDFDSHGGLWVTSEEGLFYKNSNSAKFIHGLPETANQPANSLIVMDSSYLLVGRTTDICIINLEKFYAKASDYFKIYDKSDGFSGYDCLDNGIIKDGKGRILILTSGGVDVLDPKYLKINRFPPGTYIKSVEAVTDSLTWEIINDPSLFYNRNQELSLKRDQSTIRISFIGISTTNPEKVTYQYRLSGYEEKWSAPGKGRKAVYEKLPPGNYSFQVKAFNADGIGMEQPAEISFRIKPALWQTIMFKSIVFLLIIAATILSTLKLMKYRVQIKAEKSRLQAELSQLHMGSVLKQFDPHFTFNVLSSVGSLIMKGEKELAYEYLLKLSALLRTVVSDGSAIIKPLSEELDFVRGYCEVQKLRFKERFNWSLNVDKNVDLQIEVPKLTIQIFVENAIKHGIEPRIGGGRVDIGVQNIGTGLEIRIIDNGIGRAAAIAGKSSGTGNGIKLITRLFAQMNTGNNELATVELFDHVDINNKPSGTEVRIFIPDSYSFGFN